MTKITVGGEVEVKQIPYGVEYTVDVLAHPYFDRLPLEERILLLDTEKRRSGSRLTYGGCPEWTPEQFLRMVAGRNELGDALAACLGEDNFISRQLGVKDFAAAKERLAQRRQERINRTRGKLAAEGVRLPTEGASYKPGHSSDLPF